jgi:2,4-dienoyl-CoA reductase-like NADH-dependent reductase (Old Yellow Enzyme family)
LLKHHVDVAFLSHFRATLEAVPTDLQVEYYKQRGSEGGLLISEAIFIDRLAGGYKRVPGIYNKEQIEVWKKFTFLLSMKEGRYLFTILAYWSCWIKIS